MSKIFGQGWGLFHHSRLQTTSFPGAPPDLKDAGGRPWTSSPQGCLLYAACLTFPTLCPKRQPYTVLFLKATQTDNAARPVCMETISWMSSVPRTPVDNTATPNGSSNHKNVYVLLWTLACFRVEAGVSSPPYQRSRGSEFALSLSLSAGSSLVLYSLHKFDLDRKRLAKHSESQPYRE